MTTLLVSRFALLMALGDPKRSRCIVDFGRDAGLYVSRASNSFGTPLVARGSRVELEALVRELSSQKEETR